MKLPDEDDLRVEAVEDVEFKFHTEAQRDMMMHCMSDDEGGDPMPMLILMSEKKGPIVCGIPEFPMCKSTEERQRFLYVLAKMVGNSGEKVRMIFLAHLAWHAMVDKSDHNYDAENISASMQLDRQEVLIVRGATVCGKMSHTIVHTGRSNITPEEEPLRLEGRDYKTEYSSVDNKGSVHDGMVGHWWTGYIEGYKKGPGWVAFMQKERHG